MKIIIRNINNVEIKAYKEEHHEVFINLDVITVRERTGRKVFQGSIKNFYIIWE